MDKIQFKEMVNVDGGQFLFNTDVYEGMIGKSPENVVIWVDDIGFSDPFGENTNSTPRNYGFFKDADDLLQNFMVDGESFAEEVLPSVQKINRVYCA